MIHSMIVPAMAVLMTIGGCRAEANSRAMVVRVSDWAQCVAASACPDIARPSEAPDDPVGGLTHAAARAYVEWHNALGGMQARMVAAGDLDHPYLGRLARDRLVAAVVGLEPDAQSAVRAMGVPLRSWLDECRPVQGFTPPSPSKREIFGLPPEGPELMNASGQVCTGADCAECQTTDVYPGRTETKWIFAGGAYQGMGLVLIEVEGDDPEP